MSRLCLELAAIKDAMQRIASFVHRTPVSRVFLLSDLQQALLRFIAAGSSSPVNLSDCYNFTRQVMQEEVSRDVCWTSVFMYVFAVSIGLIL
jgi:hypothetical protein